MHHITHAHKLQHISPLYSPAFYGLVYKVPTFIRVDKPIIKRLEDDTIKVCILNILLLRYNDDTYKSITFMHPIHHT